MELIWRRFLFQNKSQPPQAAVVIYFLSSYYWVTIRQNDKHKISTFNARTSTPYSRTSTPYSRTSAKSVRKKSHFWLFLAVSLFFNFFSFFAVHFFHFFVLWLGCGVINWQKKFAWCLPYRSSRVISIFVLKLNVGGGI